MHRAAGPELEHEARSRYGSCPVGQAVVTGAYRLPARLVIHAVGPRYIDGKRGEPELLKGCYNCIFKLARLHKVKSIALPSISTGRYNYPFREAAVIAVDAVQEAMLTMPFMQVRLITSTDTQAAIIQELLGPEAIGNRA